MRSELRTKDHDIDTPLWKVNSNLSLVAWRVMIMTDLIILKLNL